MGTLVVGDIVVYEGGAFSQHAGEVGNIKTISMIYGDKFISIDLLTPKETYHSPTTKSTLKGITAPSRFFKLYKQGWEV